MFTDNIDQLSADRGISQVDPLQISEHSFLILNHASKCINHSCSPNAGVRSNHDLYALREIEVDEEITYDYSTTVGLNDDMTMPCSCNTSLCRGNIGNINTIPPPIIYAYYKALALPDFIIRQLAKLFEAT